MNLSIVVPIYNVESYLEACLNSIEPILSNENVELILVNDGSKDGSEDICYKYIDKISNTKHQTPNTKHQTPNTKNQTPNTKHQTHGSITLLVAAGRRRARGWGRGGGG
ncbi:glycosyltransferase family 2 protein, partial [Neisseria gonorrhoeae]|uniref:glycosyltransferase family 2 protein n=1 Tax=Neisseria gonorrhoeae TaxID=485 RepID=UPI0021C66CF2